MKTCSHCKRTLPLDEFHKNRSTSDGHQSYCKVCLLAWQAARKAADPEAWAARRSACYVKHSEVVKAKVRAYQNANAETIREKKHQRYLDTREAHQQKHAERYRSDPDSYKARVANYKARQMGLSGTHTGADRRACFTAQDGLCFYCGASLDADWEIDHVIPMARGGGNGPDNLVACCHPCNKAKWAKSPEEFIDSLK